MFILRMHYSCFCYLTEGTRQRKASNTGVRVFVSVDFLLIYFFIGKFSQALKQSLSIILAIAQTAKDRVPVNIL